MDYTGYLKISMSQDELANFYQTGAGFEDLKENEYLIIECCGSYLYYKMKDGLLQEVRYPQLGNKLTGVMKPRNPEQYCAMDLLKDDEVPIKLITGRFGTGKSMSCIIAALDAIQSGKFEKIVFIRNNVQVKDTDALGALPGEMFDKTLPYLLPFSDHCGGIEGLQELIRVSSK